MGQHWMTFVRWATIAAWKQRVRAATGDEGDFPYQYSSDNVRFLQIRPRDVLWLVTTPRFAQPDNPKMPGRARPPAVMARLRVAAMCCNVHNEQRRVDRGELPVCLESCLRSCEAPGVLDAGVHPASDAWSIVAIGEKEPATYPALYNMFGVLDRLGLPGIRQQQTQDRNQRQCGEHGNRLSRHLLQPQPDRSRLAHGPMGHTRGKKRRRVGFGGQAGLKIEIPARFPLAATLRALLQMCLVQRVTRLPLPDGNMILHWSRSPSPLAALFQGLDEELASAAHANADRQLAGVQAFGDRAVVPSFDFSKNEDHSILLRQFL